MGERIVEEYLESIGTLEEQKSPVSTSTLAQMLNISAASVSEMLQRLCEKGLVDYTPYGGAKLTKEGWRRVLILIRSHRLWEVFLNKHLGIGWEDVYKEACNLEHATSDVVTEKLAQFLDNPDVCPHGGPILKSTNKPPRITGISLAGLEPGQEGRVIRVINEKDAEFLCYLTDLGLKPGAKVQVLDKAPFDGTLTIKVGDSAKGIGSEVASSIIIERSETQQN
jgi:DtxR family Mn-dependent transcriptional regulator